MGLLHEIQASLMDGGDLAPILLKLKFLGSRLGSAPLDEWVHYESNGYPPDVDVPSYRTVHPAYRATFSGPFGSGVRNAPIPSYLIRKYAGDHWIDVAIRYSISAVEDLIKRDDGNGEYNIDSSNLILLLQGNVYEDMACNSVQGIFSRAYLVAIQNAVRERILGFTLELEKAVPAAGNIIVGGKTEITKTEAEKVTNITNQVFHGNVTSINNSGAGSSFNFNVTQGDRASFTAALEGAGITQTDADELAAIVASEQPDGSGQPFGVKAKEWIAKNIHKALDGTWKVGLDAAGKVLAAAAIAYYGIGPT